MPMTILRRLKIISSYQFVMQLKFVKNSCIFTKSAIKKTDNWKKNSNHHKIVMEIKRQNQGIKSCQMKFLSLQLMEGNPSISW